MTQEKKPHVHAELIKAWADGAEIQFRESSIGEWVDTKYPTWRETIEYRITPAPKPDKIWYANIYNGIVGSGSFWSTKDACISSRTRTVGVAGIVKFTYDGETGKLKSVEIVE